MEITNPGLGFWQIAKEDAKRVFIEGYEIGYRHFDTAIAYRNESEIGEAFGATSPEELVNGVRSSVNPDARLILQPVAATMRTLPLVSTPAKV